jgi:hypothetical protein
VLARALVAVAPAVVLDECVTCEAAQRPPALTLMSAESES